MHMRRLTDCNTETEETQSTHEIVVSVSLLLMKLHAISWLPSLETPRGISHQNL
jgi:hypothetical protein